VSRDFISDQNWKRESLKPQNEPVHADLERAIVAADAMLERDPDSTLGYLYRGWAHMFKGQLHALAFENWSAGSEARAGKSDLDRVLEATPDDPNAHMIVGTYLYFADTLPAVLKFAQFLLRIPRGDGERGLELLASAGSRDCYLRDDARGMLGGALFGFEGRLEDGIDVFESLARDYPANVRLLEPIAVLDFFFPERLLADLPRTADVVAATLEDGDPVMRDLAARVRLYESLTRVLVGQIDRGVADLAALHRQLPKQPDWLEADVTILLAELLLLQGDAPRARALHESANPEWKKHLEFVTKPNAAATPDEVGAWHALEPIVQDLYDGRFAEAGRGLDEWTGVESPLFEFYRGELDYLSGRSVESLEHFERLIAPGTRDRFRFFRFLATLRVAEVVGRRGETERASNLLKQAVDAYPVKDLLRHVTKARARYFENGRPGTSRRS
jgi:tetratricopeptide (TPR) repeat protein